MVLTFFSTSSEDELSFKQTAVSELSPRNLLPATPTMIQKQYEEARHRSRSSAKVARGQKVAVANSPRSSVGVNSFAQNGPLSARKHPCGSGDPALRVSGSVFGDAKTPDEKNFTSLNIMKPQVRL